RTVDDGVERRRDAEDADHRRIVPGEVGDVARRCADLGDGLVGAAAGAEGALVALLAGFARRDVAGAVGIGFARRGGADAADRAAGGAGVAGGAAHAVAGAADADAEGTRARGDRVTAVAAEDTLLSAAGLGLADVG